MKLKGFHREMMHRNPWKESARDPDATAGKTAQGPNRNQGPVTFEAFGCGGYAERMSLLIRWALLAAALLLVAHLYPGVQIGSFGSALMAAAVLGLLNALLRPVLVLLTLPVTLLTLGLFLFVINAALFWAAASLLDGFGVDGFGAALIGSLLYSALGLVIDLALRKPA